MNKNLLITALFCVFVLWGCKDDDTETTKPTTNTIELKTVFDLEPSLYDGWLYYSFDTESIVPVSQANSDAWDIKFRAVDFDPGKPDNDKTKYSGLINIFLNQGFFFLNSGTVNPNGKTTGVVIDSTFTQLTTAPVDAQFRSDDTTYAGANPKSILTSQFMAYSGFPNHTVSQKGTKTLVLKTRSGRYVKMQLLSMYKNHPETPTTKDDVGFYSIAYVRGDGRKLK